MGDSRLQQVKNVSTAEDDNTIGGSTQYPGAFDSISSAPKGHRASKNTHGSPISRPNLHQKQNRTARITDNLNKQKFVTPKDNELEKQRIEQQEIKRRNLRTNAEPFW